MSSLDLIVQRRQLAEEIKSYIDRAGMPHSRFGTLAVGDPQFVTGLLAGWPTVGRKRIERARSFMRAHPLGEAQ